MNVIETLDHLMSNPPINGSRDEQIGYLFQVLSLTDRAQPWTITRGGQERSWLEWVCANRLETAYQMVPDRPLILDDLEAQISVDRIAATLRGVVA